MFECLEKGNSWYSTCIGLICCVWILSMIDFIAERNGGQMSPLDSAMFVFSQDFTAPDTLQWVKQSIQYTSRFSCFQKKCRNYSCVCVQVKYILCTSIKDISSFYFLLCQDLLQWSLPGRAPGCDSSNVHLWQCHQGIKDHPNAVQTSSRRGVPR